MVKQKGSGWHNESRRHSLARRGIKTAQKIPLMHIKKKKEIDFKLQSEIDDEIYDEAKRTQAYLFSDDDQSVVGHKEELPYWREEGNISFDGNANYSQREMNNAMERLLIEAGLTLDDIKDDLEYSWNGDADGYLSFASAEEEMPKDNLPIMHGGDSGEAELQYDDDNIESFAKSLNVSKDDLNNYLKDNWYMKDDFLYVPYDYADVVSINRDKFKKIILEANKNYNKNDMKIVMEYED